MKVHEMIESEFGHAYEYWRFWENQYLENYSRKSRAENRRLRQNVNRWNNRYFKAILAKSCYKREEKEEAK